MRDSVKRRVLAMVKQVPHEWLPGSARIGEVRANLGELRAAFGNPHDPSAGSDGKVTKVWTFETPRGKVHLRDYWWNAADEWSIGATSRKAAKWLERYVEAKLA